MGNQDPQGIGKSPCIELTLVYNSVGDLDPEPDPQDPNVFGPPGLDPDPLVRGTDPDPDPDPSLFS